MLLSAGIAAPFEHCLRNALVGYPFHAVGIVDSKLRVSPPRIRLT